MNDIISNNVRKFKNCSLFQQLIIPMLIVGLISLFITVYSAMQLKQSVAALGDNFQLREQKLRSLEEVETDIAYYRTQSLKHLVGESASRMSDLERSINETQAKIKDYIHTATDHVESEIDRSADNPTHRLSDNLDDYFKKIDTALDFSKDFEKESAFVLWSEAENELAPGIKKTIQELIRKEFTDLQLQRMSLMSAASNNLLITMALGIGSGMLLLLIAFTVTRRITFRLAGLINWSQRFSGGELTTPLKTDSEDEVGRLTDAIGTMARNIHRAHTELADAKLQAERTANALQIYAKAFENSGEAIVITDQDNKIINVNAAFVSQTGYSAKEVMGKNPRILSSGRTSMSTYRQMWHSLNEHSYWQGELWDRRKSGHVYPKWVAISAVRDAYKNVIFYIASFTDITERKETEAKIEHLAHHDILTGLLNRFSLEDRLEQSLVMAKRSGHQVAVLFIDLDRFKSINDTLGHHAGDRLLIKVAERLKHLIRESDIVARIGGDEFIIALTDVTDVSGIANVAETIQEVITQPYNVDGVELKTSPSIGISIYPSDGCDAVELLKAADVAMYHAKELGPGNFYFFTESMLVAAKARVEMEQELRYALENDQFELHYQPQISVNNPSSCRYEALVRWRHPTRGLIPPDQFIPISEETGFIHALGNWVMKEACRQLAILRQDQTGKLTIAINLSVKQLQSDTIVDLLTQNMSDYGIASEELELEITETAAMLDPELAVERLTAFRELGVTLAIDDFGTGYSSLSYLKRLPIQVLKLDRVFVNDLENNSSDAEICTATIALAHNLGLEVVAEGVETERQRKFLVSHGCDYLQGYLFSKPMPADQIASFNFDRYTTQVSTLQDLVAT